MWQNEAMMALMDMHDLCFFKAMFPVGPFCTFSKISRPSVKACACKIKESKRFTQCPENAVPTYVSGHLGPLWYFFAKVITTIHNKQRFLHVSWNQQPLRSYWFWSSAWEPPVGLTAGGFGGSTGFQVLALQRSCAQLAQALEKVSTKARDVSR